MINYQKMMMLLSFDQLVLYREIIVAFFFEILTKHTITLCGQNVEFLKVKQKKKKRI